MKELLKNIDYETPLALVDLVSFQDKQVVSRTLVQNKFMGITLFAFDKGEEISAHTSKGDALITVLDGSAKITIGKNQYALNKDQSIVMPAGIPHAVEAIEPLKMKLIVAFPNQ